MHPDIIQAIKKLPASPGVYIFKDDENNALYVGKAINLRNRLPSYISETTDSRPLIGLLRIKASVLEHVVTTDEIEALILENNFIKKFRPPYNVRLRDDKTYLSIRISVQEEFPRLTLVRKYKKDGAKYFGPFTSALQLKQAVDVIKKYYPLRRCSDHEFHNRARPCVYYDIKLCCAPCVGKIKQSDYQILIKEILEHLENTSDNVVNKIYTDMTKAAESWNFELAAELRDQLEALKFIQKKQSAHVPDFSDRDVIGIHRIGDEVSIYVTSYREGKLVDTASYHFTTIHNDAELLNQFLAQFYSSNIEYPREILLPIEIIDADIIKGFLYQKSGFKVSLKIPKRGKLKELLDLAELNAKDSFKEILNQENQQELMLSALQQKLSLKNFPIKIECYDISTIQGKFTVGSRVVFCDSKPDKSAYRRYEISPENAGDDFNALSEVISRRLKRITDKTDEAPDLILIDGGKPQLNALKDLISQKGFVGVDIVGIAKQRKIKGKIKVPERIYKPDCKKAIIIEAETPENHLLKRIRDEAHRFAINYHRKLRKKANIKSILDSIPGLGGKRKHDLLNHFGTIAAIKDADVAQLQQVPSISKKLAVTIFKNLHSDNFVDKN